ncbi:MAG TPA: 30S ribosomal protein S14 [Gemmatimonadaceae bacterium]|nr:30S ribosomal protein S14 [Gemmatimonadaceae bacterium]
MAKKSSVEKNNRRKRMAMQSLPKRKALKATIQNPKTSDADRRAAQVALEKMPRNSSPTRVRNRCEMTGRSRGFIRAFGLSRIALRELALEGKVPGLRKASW